VKNGKVEVARRDTLEKNIIDVDDIASHVLELLRTIQQDLYDRAKKRRDERTRRVDTYDEFKKEIEKGGFIFAHWDGTEETETKIKEETKATIRLIPIEDEKEEGKCMVTGNPSPQRVLFARAY
jgi:prolyl-tRNA synthetase